MFLLFHLSTASDLEMATCQRRRHSMTLQVTTCSVINGLNKSVQQISSSYIKIIGSRSRSQEQKSMCVCVLFGL